jgi:hypothetical protein
MESFDKAANLSEYERQQRLAGLMPHQRETYDRLLKDQEIRKVDLQKRQADTRDVRIQDEARRLMLRTRDLTLRKGPEQPAKYRDARERAERAIVYNDARNLEHLERGFQQEQRQFLENPQSRMARDFDKARAPAHVQNQDRNRDEDRRKRDLTQTLNRASRQRYERDHDAERSR